MKKTLWLLIATTLFTLSIFFGCSRGATSGAPDAAIYDAGAVVFTTTTSPPTHPAMQPRVIRDHLAEFAAGHPQPPPDLRTPAQLATAACSGADGVWRCKTPKPIALAAAGPLPTNPPSWSVPNWYIDPENATGCANDTNNGTSATCGAIGVGPLLTKAQLLIQRWGTSSPTLLSTVTIEWLSGDPTSTADPGIFGPTYAGGFLVLMGALPSPSFIGSLGVVTQANSVPDASVGNELESSFVVTSGTVAANMLIINNSHPSRAFAQRNMGSGNWQMSQPFTPYVPPYGFGSPVNTWISGDAVSGYVPISITIEGAFGPDVVVIAQMTTGAIFLQVSNYDFFAEDAVLSGVISTANQFTSINAVAPGTGRPAGIALINGSLLGGYLNVYSTTGTYVGYNAILVGTNRINNFYTYHTAYLDNEAILETSGLSSNVEEGSLFGPGTLDILEGSFQFSGSDTPVYSPILLNGSSTGNSLIITDGGTIAYTGIPVNQTTWAAPAGPNGFGRYAFYQGASLVYGVHP